jgi:hypothetical protein
MIADPDNSQHCISISFRKPSSSIYSWRYCIPDQLRSDHCTILNMRYCSRSDNSCALYGARFLERRRESCAILPQVRFTDADCSIRNIFPAGWPALLALPPIPNKFFSCVQAIAPFSTCGTVADRIFLARFLGRSRESCALLPQVRFTIADCILRKIFPAGWPTLRPLPNKFLSGFVLYSAYYVQH